jgi:hypothetical protein
MLVVHVGGLFEARASAKVFSSFFFVIGNLALFVEYLTAHHFGGIRNFSSLLFSWHMAGTLLGSQKEG